jgi:hypothetical protein
MLRCQENKWWRSLAVVQTRVHLVAEEAESPVLHDAHCVGLVGKTQFQPPVFIGIATYKRNRETQVERQNQIDFELSKRAGPDSTPRNVFRTLFLNLDRDSKS